MVMANGDLLLEVKNLKTHFPLDEGLVRAIDGVDFSVPRGKTLCIVGESGCGKSMTARSILQIVQPPGRIVEGEILYHRQGKDGTPGETIDLAKLHPKGKEIRSIRGKEISMIFQEPMTSLSPVHTVGDQISETIILHQEVSKEEARTRTIDVLKRVGIPRAEDRVDTYPFQLSGGMRQRCMIAMALACNPSLLIADEPTTALDVTTQAQILDLMRSLQQDLGMAMMFITHDLGVVAEIADEVVVMYLGLVVERGTVDEIFHDPKHPYTKALLKSVPRLGQKRLHRLDSIKGMVPSPFDRPEGCPFHTRCEYFIPGTCDRILPKPVGLGDRRDVRCVLYGSEADHQASDKVLEKV
jgi:peptide/nickel transport system ATP-binding protein